MAWAAALAAPTGVHLLIEPINTRDIPGYFLNRQDEAHAIVQDRPIEELVRDVEFFNADVVIFTGQRTGHAADLDYLRKIRAAASVPTLVGSGVVAKQREKSF